nr:zinc-binding dehydrogenase [Sphingobium sp. Z007]
MIGRQGRSGKGWQSHGHVVGAIGLRTGADRMDMGNKGALTQRAEKIEHQRQRMFDHGRGIIHGDMAVHARQESGRFPSPDEIGSLTVKAQNFRGVIESLVKPGSPHVAPDADQLRAGDAQRIALLRLDDVQNADAGERARVLRGVWPAVQQRCDHHRRSVFAHAMRDQLSQLVKGAGLDSPFGCLSADDRLDLRQRQPVFPLKSPYGQNGLHMLVAIISDGLARTRGFGNKSFAQIDTDCLPMDSGPPVRASSEQLRKQLPNGVDCVLDTSGAVPAIDAGVASLAPLGRLAIVGVPRALDAAISLNILTLLSLGISICGVTEGNADPQTFLPELIALHAKGLFPFEKLITTYRLEDINQAIKDQHDGRCVKAVLTMA